MSSMKAKSTSSMQTSICLRGDKSLETFKIQSMSPSASSPCNSTQQKKHLCQQKLSNLCGSMSKTLHITIKPLNYVQHKLRPANNTY
jgi:hypothetical protein